MKGAEHILHMAEVKNAYTILVGKPQLNRSLRRPGGRWVGNIKMVLRDYGGLFASKGSRTRVWESLNKMDCVTLNKLQLMQMGDCVSVTTACYVSTVTELFAVMKCHARCRSA
jgi:hypothetical protein